VGGEGCCRRSGERSSFPAAVTAFSRKSSTLVTVSASSGVISPFAIACTVALAAATSSPALALYAKFESAVYTSLA